MSNTAVNRVKKLRLPPMEKYVLWAIADRTNPSGKCWPSVATIAADTGLSRATVKRAQSRLKAIGIIQREERHCHNGRQTSSITTLNLDFDWPRARLGEVIEVTAQGVTPSPPGGSDRAPLTNEEPKHGPTGEPFEKSDEKSPSLSARKLTQASALQDHPGELGVTFENGDLVLHNGFRTRWLGRFGSDTARLELALARAANFVDLRGSKSLEIQVNAQLALQLAEKCDRDARYAAARNANASSPKRQRIPSRFGGV